MVLTTTISNNVKRVPENLDHVLSRLTNVKKVGSGFNADCPVSGHITPEGHLSIKEVNNMVVVKCHGNHRHDYKMIAEALDFDTLTYASGKKEVSRIVATFRYEIKHGQEYYAIDRIEPGKTKSKDFVAKHLENGAYVFNMNGRKAILYHLPQVRDWVATGKTVFVPEGEYKADKLISMGLAATTSPFGANRGNWKPEFSQELAGANVVILSDNDTPGKAFAEEKASNLHIIARSVKVVELPGLMPKGDIIDWLGLGHTKEELLSLVEDTLEWTPLNQPNEVLPSTAEELPEIKVGNRQLRDITSDGLTALELANEPVPSLFRFGSGLTRISHKDNQSPYLEPVTEPAMRYLLSTSATFKKYNKEGNSFDCLPPLDLARNILVASEEWRFPKLSGLVEVPVLRPDFSVLSSPGYDPATGLYLETQKGLEIPDIPDKPTDSELQDAVAMISEPFADFYFIDAASRANMIGALLLPIIRQAINGPVPLVAINKSQPGCGGSLLTDIIAIIASGRPAYMAQAAREDEEWRKLLTSILLAGHRFVVFDNIDRIIESAALASFVTALIWQDRLLGQSTTVQLPNSTVCFLNGNNIKVGGNLARRIVPVGLDAPDCRPWLRDPNAFKHPDLRRWALDNRGAIISSILTVVRGWVAAGQPKAKNPVSLGSFESYSHIVGDILSFMGINGFLTNLHQLYDEMDVDTPMWANFFEVWHSEIGDTPLTVAGLVARLGDIPDLKAALPDTVSDVDRPNYTRRLGKQLAKRERQKFPGGLTLVKAGDKKRSVLWRVVSYENANSPIFTNKSEFGEFTPPLIVEASGCENNKYKGAVQNSPKLTAEAKSGELCPTNSPTDPVPPSLGMSDEDALTIWREHGAPVVHLGRGENCMDLKQLLSRDDLRDDQLQAVKAWLYKHMGDY